MSAEATEKCACGAEITAESDDRLNAANQVRRQLEDWRDNHQCPVRNGPLLTPVVAEPKYGTYCQASPGEAPTPSPDKERER